MLDCLNMWPKRRNRFSKLSFWIMLFLTILLETGQVVYFIINIKDLAKMASSMSTISTTFQVNYFTIL